ncbi:GntR family transcriptional regulator [Pseudochelatococcus sp. B33]
MALYYAPSGDKARPEEMVIAELQRDIMFGRLRPRERLVEADLAERFGVGRHVIRTAFDQLVRDGLVERRANRGVIVYDRKTEEVEQLYEMREILQRAAAERVPLPAAPSLIERLKEINAQCRAYLADGALTDVAAANDKFHNTMFEACGNKFLAQSIEEYWLKTAATHCYAIGVPNLAQQSLDEHDGMIEALKSDDRKLLVKLCIDHMYPALKAYKAAHGGWGA